MKKTQKAQPVFVIMAGGSGERFWPVSNRSTPKQLLRLHGENSLLREAFERTARLAPVERIFVAAGEGLRKAIHEELPRLAPGNYIAEPFGHNTAACLGLAACDLADRFGPETPMGVLTADHLIEKGPVFEAAIEAALARAAECEELIAIGIEPSCPDTAFGYLELGETVGQSPTAHGEEAIWKVRRFTEKPDLAKAEHFLAQGNYLWNSGMFFWRIETLLEAFERHQPVMAKQWTALRASGPAPYPLDRVAQAFHGMPSLPIDTAIMENSDKVTAVRGRFGWEDVGSWDALARIAPADETGNWRFGSSIMLDSTDNIVYNQHARMETAPEIVLYGVEGLIVIRTEKAVLVVPKSKAQGVKSIVKRLAETEREDLL